MQNNTKTENTNNNKDESHTTQLSELTKEALDKLQGEDEYKRHASELVQNDLVKPPLMQHPTTHLTEQQQQQQQQQQLKEQQEKVKNELLKDFEPKLAQFAFMSAKDKNVAESAQKMSDSPTRTSQYVRLLSESDAEPAQSKRLLTSQLQAMTASSTPKESMETEKHANTKSNDAPPSLQDKNEGKQATTDKSNNDNAAGAEEAAATIHNVTDAKETVHKSVPSSASSALGQSSTTHVGITPAASSTTSSTHSSALPLASSMARASNSLGLSLSGRLSHVEASRCFVLWASYDYLEKKHPALMPSDEDDGKRKKTKDDKSITQNNKETKSLFPSSYPQNINAKHPLPHNENTESSTSSSSSSLSLSSNSSLWSPYHQVEQPGNTNDKAQNKIWESSSTATQHTKHELPDKKDDDMSDAPHPKEPLQSNMQKQQTEQKEHVRTMSSNLANVDANNNNNNTDTTKTNKSTKMADDVDKVHYNDEGVCVAEDDVILLKASELLEVKIVSAPFDQKSKKATVVAFVAKDKCAEQCDLPTQENDKTPKPTTEANEFTPLLQKHHEHVSSPSAKTNTAELNDERTNPLHMQKLSSNTVDNSIYTTTNNNSNKQNKHPSTTDRNNRAPHTTEYKFALLRGGAVKLSDALRSVRPDLNTDVVLGSPLLSVAQDDEKDKKHQKRNEATTETEHVDAEHHNHTESDHGKDNEETHDKNKKKELHDIHEDHLDFSKNDDKSGERDKKEGSLLGRAIDMVKNVVLPIPAEEREHVKRSESKILPHHNTQAQKENLMQEQEKEPKNIAQQQKEQDNEEEEEEESSRQQSPITPPPSPESMLGKFQRESEEDNENNIKNHKEEVKPKAGNAMEDNKLTSDGNNNKKSTQEKDQKLKQEQEQQQQQEKQEQEQQREQEQQQLLNKKLQQQEEQKQQRQEQREKQQNEEEQKEEQQEQELLNTKLQEQEQKNKSEMEHKLQQEQLNLQQSEEQERDHVLRKSELTEKEELEKQEKEERDRLNSHDTQTEVKPTPLPSQASSNQANEVIQPKLKPSQMEMGSPLTTFDWQFCFVNDEAARKSTSVSTNSLVHPSPRSLSPHPQPQEGALHKAGEFINNNNNTTTSPITSSVNKNSPTVLPDVQVPGDKDNKSEQITESDQKHEIEEQHDEMKRDKVVDEQVKAEERELAQDAPVKPASTTPIPTPTPTPTPKAEIPKSNSPHASPEQHSLPPSRSNSSPPHSAAGQTLSPSQEQQQQQQQQSLLGEEELRSLQQSALHISTRSQSLSTASSAASMETVEKEDETHTIRVESKYQKAREKAFFGGIEEYIRFEV